jgi:hypothetical protein
MSRAKKASRPRERTARAIDAAAPGAWYAPRFEESRIVGVGAVVPVPGKPGFVVAIGAIDGGDEFADRPIEFHVRSVLDARRVVRHADRAESTEVLLLGPRCRSVRIGLRASLGTVLRALRVARAKAGG